MTDERVCWLKTRRGPKLLTKVQKDYYVLWTL